MGQGFAAGTAGRTRGGMITLATVAALGIGAVVGAPVAGAQASGSDTAAVVSPRAAHGGAVIVTFRNQLSTLKVRGAAGRHRQAAVHDAQAGVRHDIAAHGGSHLLSLVSVNALAARVPAAEVTRLSHNAAVASIVPDSTMRTASATTLATAKPPKLDRRLCPANPAKPLLEPEALTLTKDRSQPNTPDMASTIATGKGVVVGLTGINGMAGNPNLIRPDGEHVVIDSPTPNADDADFDGGGDEWYGDASSVAAQGTVTYDFSKELPYSGLPTGCTFRIVGIAPGASLVDVGGYIGDQAVRPKTEEPMSAVIAGLDHAAIYDGAQVVSESYGFTDSGGVTDFTPYFKANDALVAAGITVVTSSGDQGVGGTLDVEANDPLVISAGATNSYRQYAQAYGYRGWVSNQMAALSSAGVGTSGGVVDLVAPGDGGQAICSPAAASCPQNTITESFGGTSQSAPFIAGAAADVIQAYQDSHGGGAPTPAEVKSILTGTAADLDDPADQQGAGLLDVYAAVRAAQQLPGTTTAAASPALVPTPTQLRVSGEPGSTSTQHVSLYNASTAPATVRGTVRDFGPVTQLGRTVTEAVSAPDPLPAEAPAQGYTAAAPIHMKVPAGVGRLGVDMRTPNPKNDAVLALLLFDPKGRITQISYDYSITADGPVSNNENVQVADPMPGTWTAQIVWNNGRGHLQDPPILPGSYRGNIAVRFTAQDHTSTPATRAVTIAPHSTTSVPVPVTMPTEPGDTAPALQFTSNRGATATVPLVERTRIPTAGGSFTTVLGSSVARYQGPLHNLTVRVPKGKTDMRVTFATADASADNIIDYYLVEPDGVHIYADSTPSPTTHEAGEAGHAAITVTRPMAGLWTVQVFVVNTESGKEFDQPVTGTLAYDTARAHAYALPSGSYAPASTVPLQVAVTNTLRVGRTFRLLGNTPGVTSAAVYIPAGATALVTGTLAVTAAPGTTVAGRIYVVAPTAYRYLDNGGDIRSATSTQPLAQLRYRYTVTGSGT